MTSSRSMRSITETAVNKDPSAFGETMDEWPEDIEKKIIRSEEPPPGGTPSLLTE